jgi:hypothetical protein
MHQTTELERPERSYRLPAPLYPQATGVRVRAER